VGLRFDKQLLRIRKAQPEMSGGQQQRRAGAGAYHFRPQLLLDQTTLIRRWMQPLRGHLL
jgi:ABC-type dipeptide/oligopeptide/nickel transport system ATPase subunit